MILTIPNHLQNNIMFQQVRRIILTNSKLVNRRFMSEKKYLETLEWYYQTPQNTIRLGISQEALEKMTDLVYLEVDDLDYQKEYEKGTELMNIESVKAVSPLYAPSKCKIISYNEELVDDLTSINENPEDINNWIVELEEL